jgi:hypothetical protein
MAENGERGFESTGGTPSLSISLSLSNYNAGAWKSKRTDNSWFR